MGQTEEILNQLKEKKRLMLVSENQEQLENIYEEICEAGFRNVTMPLFEEELSKQELQRELNQCLLDIHRVIKPLGKSMIEVSRKLERNHGENVECELPYVEQLTLSDVEALADVLEEYEDAAKLLYGKCREDSYNGISVTEYTEDLERKIQEYFPKLITVFQELAQLQERMTEVSEGEFLKFDWSHLEAFISLYEKILRLQKIPIDWLYQADLDKLFDQSRQNMKKCLQYMHIRHDISEKYQLELLDMNGQEIEKTIVNGMKELTTMLRIHGQNEGFIMDNLRHIEERSDLLLGDIALLEHDVQMISDITGCEEKATFQNIAAFYQISDFLAHKPKGFKGAFTQAQVSSTAETIRKIEISYKTVDEIKRQLNYRYQERFLSLDAEFLMERFGRHAGIKKYMINQKQLYRTEINHFIEEMEQGELALKSSWETLSKIFIKEVQIPEVRQVSDIDTNLSICKAVLGEIKPCKAWLDDREREHLLLEIEECEQRCLTIQRMTYQLMEAHNEQIFQINYEELMPRFQKDYQGFMKHFKGSYKQDKELIKQTYLRVPENLTDEEIVRVLEMLRSLQQQRELFRQKRVFLIEQIGGYYHGENTNWGLLKADIKQFEEITAYFDTPEEAYANLNAAKEAKEQLMEYYAALMTLRNAVRERAAVFYTGGEFETASVEDIIERFARMISEAQRMDRDFCEVCGYLKEIEGADEVSYQEILHGVQSLDKLNRDREWIEQKEMELRSLFGEEFEGKETDWNQLKERLNGMKSIYTTFDTGMVGDKLNDFLLDDSKTFLTSELSVGNYKAMRTKIETELKSFLQVPSLNGYTLEEVVIQLEKVKELCSSMDDIFTQVSSLCKRREHAKNMLEDLKQFALMQKIEEEFSEDSETEHGFYGALYQGIVTDWNAIGDKIQLAKSMRSDVGKYHLSRNFLEAVLDSETTGIDVYHDSDVLTSATVYKNEFSFAASLFAPEIQLEKMEFQRVYRKLSNCLRDTSLIGSWIAFQQGKVKCAKHGLVSFLTAVEAKQLESEKIRESFIETFYTLWLERQMYEKGGLHPYRVKSYEEVREIEKLDEEKKDIRMMELEDYLIYVPNWLSRRKYCLIVKNDLLITPFYDKIVLFP